MTTLLGAMQTKNSFTENGMVTNSSSLNECVNLFFQIGAMRGQDKTRLINAFTKAFGENPLTAMKLLFWARDVRGGAGERQIFKDIVSYLATNRTAIMAKNIHLISEFGRWDDIEVLFGTPLEGEALKIISDALANKNGLCAKWMPRPNVKNREAKRIANTIRKHLGLAPKDYRKLLVENSNTVEQLMCAREFSRIDYNKLPSKAMSDYMKAFSKNDLARFQDYLSKLEKGEAKINASALYPYDVIKNLKQGNTKGADLQWNALPNFMETNNERIIPLVDVSGSMDTPVAGNPNLRVMDIAVSLGLYISERNVAPFKDAFITFETNPKLFVVKGSLSERYRQMIQSPWGGSTDVERAFGLVLDSAVKHSVPQSEMPTMMLILSDMEFNQASRWSDTAQDMIERKFKAAGYEMPKIVYWNLASRGDSNKPVQFDKNGTALVSGFSPSILTNLLGGNEMTPYSMMMKVVDSERYAPVTI
jgi:hypothetical protein